LPTHLTLSQVGVNLLQDGNAEGRRLAGARLSLGDHVHSLEEKAQIKLQVRPFGSVADPEGSKPVCRIRIGIIGSDPEPNGSEYIFLVVTLVFFSDL